MAVFDQSSATGVVASIAFKFTLAETVARETGIGFFDALPIVQRVFDRYSDEEPSMPSAQMILYESLDEARSTAVDKGVDE